MSTTYEKTTTENKLTISLDSNPFNPRENCNLGIFITHTSRNISIDDNNELEEILKSTLNTYNNVTDRITIYTKEAQEILDSPIIYISPITVYEHSGSRYDIEDVFNENTSPIGFVIVTQKTLDNIGINKDNIKAGLEAEIETYNQYLSGEIYRFTLYDDDGEVMDSCSGFYDMESMKDHLPQEYKNLDLEQFLK